jgi:predicted RecB family nuclease
MDVAVIDYKFGEQELVKHEKQVATYARLLREMGYEPESWLYYVKLDKVWKVEG